MTKKKILFLDRDGTLIQEPKDEQVDTLEKLSLLEKVIPSLLRFKEAGYRFVIVSNQDGLGTPKYSKNAYKKVQTKMLQLFNSQGIAFDAVLICTHFLKDECSCRKPKTKLVESYLRSKELDPEHSYVIGDRATDLELAKNMGLKGYRLGNWEKITSAILDTKRTATIKRKTKETKISVTVNLDGTGISKIDTGIGFFDHMLEQIGKHSGIDLIIKTQGDLHIDEHHTVEDTGLALGKAIAQALGDKTGISRYGFMLPMDEALAQVTLDLSGRPFFSFKGKLPRDMVGTFPTELVPHFFRSLSDTLRATLHIQVEGENTHHMVEATFKGTARALKMALSRSGGNGLPSTKGIL